MHLIAVAQFGGRKIVAAQELDHRQVAGRIDADDDRVVQLAVRHSALHTDPGLVRDMEIGERIALGRDDDARAASLSFLGEDGHKRRRGLGDRGNPLRLGFFD